MSIGSKCKLVSCQTDRPLFRVKKFSDSGKSTTNESETKQISREQANLYDQWQIQFPGS